MQIQDFKLKNLKKEYFLKKERINKRLLDFDNFYNKSFSWFFNNGKMELKGVNTNEDSRIFEELCFCILTANTSAEMGMHSIDTIRNLLVKGSAEEMSKKLEGIYRFKNLRPAYILHTRNYLQKEFNFKLKEKIESLKDNKEELRDFFAFNKGIKGLGYKEASHFLRNIGFKGYAILDKHIINSLYEFKIIGEPKRPSTRDQYREMEQKMILFSNEIRIPMDELDLLFWSRKNGKILK
jgi:N-glycosylase/DNA lyase|tara:strand:- start:376 stop:1089 length:714 start_codon:yes stop_codon:yes gene_type:complete